MDITKFGQDAMKAMYTSCSNPRVKGKATITVKNTVVHRNSSVSEKKTTQNNKSLGAPSKSNMKSIGPAKVTPSKIACGNGNGKSAANAVNKKSVVPFKTCTAVSNKKVQTAAGKKQGNNAKSTAAKSVSKAASTSSSTVVRQEQVVKMTMTSFGFL